MRIPTRLSQRESEILKLAEEGLTDGEIGKKLGIAEGTIGTYWGRIRVKMGPHSRTELVAASVRQRLSQEMASLSEVKDQLEQELEHLKEAEAFLQYIINQEDHAILATNADDLVIFANSAALGMLSQDGTPLAGRPVSEFLAESVDPEPVNDGALSTAPANFRDGAARTLDGRFLPISVAAKRGTFRQMECTLIFIRSAQIVS